MQPTDLNESQLGEGGPLAGVGPETHVHRNHNIQNIEYRIQNTENRIQNTEHRIQNTEYRIQNTEYRLLYIKLTMYLLLYGAWT